MKSRICLLIVAGLLSLPAVAQENCDRPWPLVVPDSVTDRDEILKTQRAVKDYLAKANTYLECNEAAQNLQPAGDTEADRKRQNLIHQYNNTVEEMHQVGDRFNVLVRAYKASHPDQ